MAWFRGERGGVFEWSWRSGLWRRDDYVSEGYVRAAETYQTAPFEIKNSVPLRALKLSP